MKVKELIQRFECLDGEEEIPLEAVVVIYLTETTDEDIVYFNGLRGPIRIWEISYPDNIEFKEEFLGIEYPKSLRLAK